MNKLIIIGSGPAAWTAAIYAARASLNPLVVEGAISEENRLKNTLPLGQLATTTEVENFPGFPEGVDGPELMQRMKDQAVRFGTTVETDDVVSIVAPLDTAAEQVYAISLLSGTTLYAQSIIIATGASAKWLGAKGENEFKNRGVSACAVCDGALPRFRGKVVAVVGGGDSACEEALYLTKYAQRVDMIVRGDKLRASKVMQDRVLALTNPDRPSSADKILIQYDREVREVLGNDAEGVTGLKVGFSPNVHRSPHLYKRSPYDEWTIEVAGMFAAIGHRPNTAFLGRLVDLDEHGYIVVNGTKTSKAGIFAAGDVSDPHYRQAIFAAGMGCAAALDAERYLSTL